MSMALAQRLSRVRQHSLDLVAPLEPEDLCLQGMADASPPKWHLGHTTWFFETFVLLNPLLQSSPAAVELRFEPADPRWGYLFNSYYDAVGERQPRTERGLLSRPPIGAVLAWRARVDAALEHLLGVLEAPACPLEPQASSALLALVELGLHHEQQHQELLLMDLLDGFSRNALEPAYGEGPERIYAAAWAGQPPTPAWLEHPGGLVEIGVRAGSDRAALTSPDLDKPDLGKTDLDKPDLDKPGLEDHFYFDHESPRHREWLEPFAIANRLVNNAEYAAFIADGGYQRPELWMSEGWALAQQRGWQSARYWRDRDEFSLAGRRARQAEAPVRHLSWFEADAYARWSGARLPSETEWEVACHQLPLEQAFGVVWQWTSSPYRPYPGFQPAAGAVGEYNGKFMSSQMVLRGSCFLTPEGHSRPSYRNFFAPASRWMAAGLRLAQERPASPSQP